MWLLTRIYIYLDAFSADSNITSEHNFWIKDGSTFQTGRIPNDLWPGLMEDWLKRGPAFRVYFGKN
jgi:hypothetical protein